MASKAPLVLAAVLFVVGLAGLAQATRQTRDPADSEAMHWALLGRRVETPVSPVAVVTATSAPAPEPQPTETVPATAASAATPTAPQSPAVPETPTPTPSPPPAAAIAAAIAADGPETVANATVLPPLHVGMIGRDADDETSGGEEPVTLSPDPSTSD